MRRKRFQARSNRIRTLFCRADHCLVLLVGSVVVRLHLHPVLGPEHLRVLTVPQEVLVVLLQVPEGQPVLVHPQSLKLKEKLRSEPTVPNSSPGPSVGGLVSLPW